MTDEEICSVLRRYKQGSISEREAAAFLEKSSVEEMGFAEVDHARERRQGFPEVIYGEGKTGEQVLAIMEALAEKSAGFTPFAFAKALRIGSSRPVYVAGFERRDPLMAD